MDIFTRIAYMQKLFNSHDFSKKSEARPVNPCYTMSQYGNYKQPPLHWAIRLRISLLINGTRNWNAWVRDFTAWLERNF